MERKSFFYKNIILELVKMYFPVKLTFPNIEFTLTKREFNPEQLFRFAEEKLGRKVCYEGKKFWSETKANN